MKVSTGVVPRHITIETFRKLFGHCCWFLTVFADQLKDTDLKGEVDKEQSNNLIQQESESLGTKQESEEG